MKTYAEKLKDPRWQKKRLEIMQRDNFRCQGCGDSDTTLHVHHTRYDRNPWDVENHYLITLCERCHEVTGKLDKLCKEYGIELVLPLASDLWEFHFYGINKEFEKDRIFNGFQCKPFPYYQDGHI